jgi:Ni,Fe-hydrogenase III large subunit
MFDTVKVAASGLTAGSDQVQAARLELAALRSQAERGWHELLFNPTFQERLPGVGIVTADDARRLGTVGPAARAAGLAEDARATCRRLSYDGFVPVTPEQATGDVKARFEQRGLELWQSLEILDRLLDHPLRPAAAKPGAAPRPLGVGRVESPRGATTCVIERDGDQVSRLHLRTSSYANWPSVAFAAAGNMLPDFPLINKSFELCYACADR